MNKTTAWRSLAISYTHNIGVVNRHICLAIDELAGDKKISEAVAASMKQDLAIFCTGRTYWTGSIDAFHLDDNSMYLSTWTEEHEVFMKVRLFVIHQLYYFAKHKILMKSFMHDCKHDSNCSLACLRQRYRCVYRNYPGDS